MSHYIHPSKEAVALAMLEEGPIVVQLDARDERADVPKQFKNDVRLVLRFGSEEHGLTPPIRDLYIDDLGIGASLHFGGRPHRCWVPWSAVYVIGGPHGECHSWPDEAPVEAMVEMIMSEQGGEIEEVDEVDEVDPPKPSKKPFLRIVK